MTCYALSFTVRSGVIKTFARLCRAQLPLNLGCNFEGWKPQMSTVIFRRCDLSPFLPSLLVLQIDAIIATIAHFVIKA